MYAVIQVKNIKELISNKFRNSFKGLNKWSPVNLLISWNLKGR